MEIKAGNFIFSTKNKINWNCDCCLSLFWNRRRDADEGETCFENGVEIAWNWPSVHAAPVGAVIDTLAKRQWIDATAWTGLRHRFIWSPIWFRVTVMRAKTPAPPFRHWVDASAAMHRFGRSVMAIDLAQGVDDAVILPPARRRTRDPIELDDRPGMKALREAIEMHVGELSADDWNYIAGHSPKSMRRVAG